MVDIDLSEWRCNKLKRFLSQKGTTTFDVKYIKRPLGRKRRQVAIPLVISGITSYVTHVIDKHELNEQKEQLEKQIQFSNVETAKLADLTNKDLSNLEINFDNLKRESEKQVNKICQEVGQVTDRVFVNQIKTEIESYKSTILKFLVETNSRARHSSFMTSAIHICRSINRNVDEAACYSYMNLQRMEVTGLTPSIDTYGRTTIKVKVIYSIANLRRIGPITRTLEIGVPIGRKGKTYFYEFTKIPRKITAISNEPIVVDKCTESPVDGSTFCNFENIYNKEFDGNCVKSVVSRNSLACPKEILLSSEQCITKVTKDYILVSSFVDFYSIEQEGYIGSRKTLSRGPNVTLLKRPEDDTMYGCGTKTSLIKGRTSSETEMISLENGKSSGKYIHDWLSTGEFGHIASYTNITALHNKEDYKHISELLNAEKVPAALAPMYERLKPYFPTFVICSTIIMIVGLLICSIRRGYITSSLLRKLWKKRKIQKRRKAEKIAMEQIAEDTKTRMKRKRRDFHQFNL